MRSTLPGAAGETTWHQLYDLAGRPLTAVDDQGHWLRSEVWANGQRLATLTPDGVSYAHLDGQGSLRARSRADGSLAQTCTALPFGDNLLCSGSDPSPLHLTGKLRDEETGLDDFGARYYASTLGRFVSPDWSAQAEPVPYAQLENPQSLNLYSYVQNNPVSATDPDGHYRQAPGGTAGGNCGYPCTVTGQGGRVPLVNRLKGLGLLISATQEVSWQQTKQMVTAPFFLWFRGWGNFLLNGKATGLGMVAAGLAGALPGDEEIAGAEDATAETQAAISRGSTGRTEPASLNEQIAMKAAKANPLAGERLPIKMRDSRWPASEGWIKMQQRINGINIHYVYNEITGAAEDWKFK